MASFPGVSKIGRLLPSNACQTHRHQPILVQVLIGASSQHITSLATARSQQFAAYWNTCSQASVSTVPSSRGGGVFAMLFNSSRKMPCLKWQSRISAAIILVRLSLHASSSLLSSSQACISATWRDLAQNFCGTIRPSQPTSLIISRNQQDSIDATAIVRARASFLPS